MLKNFYLLKKSAFAIILLFLYSAVSAQTNVQYDIVVAPDGTGNFSSIQKAIDAAPSNSSRPTVIYIKRGLYNSEKLIVSPEKKNITLVGESREETIISYHIYDCTSGKCPAEDAAKWTGDNIRTSATLTIQGDGFKAENLTIQNTAGPVGQAQAITVQADKIVFINCNLKSYQDTIYLWTSADRTYFGNCLIVGRTDYIYGAGIGYFDSCEIRSWGGGWITAPATPKSQSYGFVFHSCKLTYAANSPRAGDDGVKFRFGRPWHEYPKVAWLYCEISEMLNPQGWGDTWSMSYAATSSDLHLYEYANTGTGADMSGRAAWAGLRSLTSSESLNYTVQKVMAGSDNWDPSAQAPLVKNYTWSGKAATHNWLDSGNWTPAGVPLKGEAASVSGNHTLLATGDFQADLNMNDSAKIEVSGSANLTFLSANGIQILAKGDDQLSGKIATKDSLVFSVSGKLTLNATLSGVHKLIKRGAGTLILAGDNSNFSGKIEIQEGTIEATGTNSLGKGKLEVKPGARLVIGTSSAFFPKSSLTVASGAFLEMKDNITISEFYIGGIVQNPGEYSAATHPDLISNSGKIVVGRPAVFEFIGGANGNWDNPAHYSPALLPEAGETVICSIEMETTSSVFAADIRFKGQGRLRLRGAHKATGTIFMEDGTSVIYNTSGTGMALNAPITIEGNVTLILESSNTAGSTMKLEGPLSGNGRITAINNGRGTVNTGTVLLSGNNSKFTGTWDLTKYSTKYPSVKGYTTLLEGASEYAFGAARIEIGQENKLVIGHALAAQPKLRLSVAGSARVLLKTVSIVEEYELNGTKVLNGSLSAITNPELYEGGGTLTVIGPMSSVTDRTELPLQLSKRAIHVLGNKSRLAVYNLTGQLLISEKNTSVLYLNSLPTGIYLLKYLVDGKSGVLKFATN